MKSLSVLFRSLLTPQQIAPLPGSTRRMLPKVVKHLRTTPHGPNVLGSFVVCCALGFLYFQAQSITAGSDPAGEPGGQTFAAAAQEFAEPTCAEAPSNSSAPTETGPKLVGKEALIECDRILDVAESTLTKAPGYSATFVKQERIGGNLSELQVIQFRMFHDPKKVLMKWQGGKDDGQRLLFSQGENDGDMLVRKTKGLEAALGVLSLNPEGSIAMKHSRYPVTKAGLLELTKVIRQQRAADLKHDSGVTVAMMEHQKYDNRDAITFTIEYDREELAPDEKHEYRKVVIFIDSASKLPVCVRGYGWPDKISGAKREKLDQTTLIELYAYKNIDFEAIPVAADFTRAKLQ